MGLTESRRSWYAPAARAAAEAAAFCVAGGALAGWLLPAPKLLWAGVGAAWAACTAGTFALAWGRSRSPAWFWRAFGAGVALRLGVLVALAAVSWARPVGEAAALLGAYVVALSVAMLLELRHLVKDLKAARKS